MNESPIFINLFTAIDTDWSRLARSRAAHRRLQQWRDSTSGFGDSESVTEVVEDIRLGSRPVSRALSRALCWGLLDLVAGGDDLAGRVLFQAIVPGLAAITQRLVTSTTVFQTLRVPGHEIAAMVTVEAFQAINDRAGTHHRYPIADIVRRARRLTETRIRHERDWTVHQTNHDDSLINIAAPPVGGDVDAVLRDQVMAEVISARDVQVVWLTRHIGFSPAEVADAWGQTPDAIRRRRHRAEQRLHAVLADSAGLAEVA